MAILSTVLLGMGALTIDLGTLYVAKTELQAAADSAALAAAGQLVYDGGGDPVAAARQAAEDVARRNPVLGAHAGLANSDVELGRAVYNASTNRFDFSAGVQPYDAARVTVRRTADSEGGAIAMGFANIFGRASKDLWARAAAVQLPRDIAVVIDLSGSMNDDSELRHYKQFQGDTGAWRNGVQINLRDIWCALDGPRPSVPYVPGAENQTEYANDTGPSVGVMTQWGSAVIPETYDPTSDSGLWYIRKGYTTTDPAVSSSLTTRGYTAMEVSALLSASRDSSYANNFRNRVGIMLGLATWASGMPGAPFPGGNGNTTIDDTEVSWIPKPSWYNGSWTNYINYPAGSSHMSVTQGGLRCRYGLKTLTNFLLERFEANAETPQLARTPEQPVQAVKDAVHAMVGVIDALDSLDRLSLEVFATSVHHEIDLTDMIYNIPAQLYDMQAGHYDPNTNIAAGIAQGVVELTSTRARPAAAKIMVLMSDGKPNIDENGNYVGYTPQVQQLTIDQARIAHDNQIRIYTISVGEDVDRTLMQQIAIESGGQEFHATGTPEEYTQQMEAIFRSLGGKRPVALIE